MKRFYIALVLLVMLLVLSACASDSLTVSDAWARPAAAGQNSAVYFALQNGTGVDHKIIGVQGEAAKMIETHETMIDANNVASMHHRSEIDVPAGETVKFEPGGLHVMMMMLQNDLNPGDTVTITLRFEDHADLEITAEVREP